MSKLSEFLKAHLHETNRLQKDVAGAFQSAYRALGGKELTMNTLEPKLSKLLAGEVEGVRFFLEDATRRQAFAAAVGLPEAELERLRDVRTLVLDPALPKEAREYFVARETAPDARHCCVLVERGSSSIQPRDDLRRVAKEHPGCLVVLLGGTDAAFYEGASIDFSAATQHPRGWIVERAKDLVPLPPPPPPRLFGAGGQPMMPCEELAEAVREQTKRSFYGPYDIAKRVADADKVGATPTFCLLAEVGPHAAERDKRRHVSWGRAPELRWDFSAGNPGWDPMTTYVWAVESKLFVVGPEAEWVRNLIAPYHTAVGPTSLDMLREAVEQWNPWLTLPPDPYRNVDTSALCSRYLELQRILRTEGFSLESVVKDWWAHRDPESESSRNKIESPWTLAVSDEGERERALSNLERLLGRTFELDDRTVHQLFRLRLVLRADIATIARQPDDLLHLVANVGAGHLLRVRVLEFPHEDSMPIHARVPRNLWDLDGGDVHIIIRRLGDDVALEASPMPALRRRERARLEEEARSYDD